MLPCFPALHVGACWGWSGCVALSSHNICLGCFLWCLFAILLCVGVQDDEVDQELLLDTAVPAVGSGHGGLIELPLSYNLTGHTGSLMYMAPEVYKVSSSGPMPSALQQEAQVSFTVALTPQLGLFTRVPTHVDTILSQHACMKSW